MEVQFETGLFNRVLIAAVNKSSINPKLHFFNNCFGDDYSKRMLNVLNALTICSIPFLAIPR